MKPINECKTVAELLEDPKRWTKGTYARDQEGKNTDETLPNATCFCAAGALHIIYGYGHEYSESRTKLCGVIGINWLTEWNDDPARTHSEVLEAVRKAGI